MQLGIEGLGALVLGGTAGLGFSCAKALHENGVRVVLIGRDAERGKAAVQNLGEGAYFLPADLADHDSHEAVCQSANELLGRPLSILVSNAGGPKPGRFADHAISVWRDAIELNMLAHVHIAQLLLPAMIEQGFGRIVNITSFAAKEPYQNMALANAARAGLHGAMATLAREVVSQGVTVNSLLPGLMDTGALQRVIDARMRNDGVSEQTVRDNMASSVPAGRLGTADDFGPTCAFLCSRHASYITGQNIAIDGGLVRSLF